MVDEEQAVSMVLVHKIDQRIHNIREYDLIAAAVQQVCDKTTADLACAKMYCFFHNDASLYVSGRIWVPGRARIRPSRKLHPAGTGRACAPPGR